MNTKMKHELKPASRWPLDAAIFLSGAMISLAVLAALALQEMELVQWWTP